MRWSKWQAHTRATPTRPRAPRATTCRPSPQRYPTRTHGPHAHTTIAQTVTSTIEAHEGIVRLSVDHVSGTVDVTGVVGKGWPAVRANLKTFLESGRAMPVEPWAMA